MKKKYFHLVLFCTLALVALPAVLWAGSATLTWNANTETDLSGYRVYCGTASRNYGAPVSVGKATQYTLNNLADGATYYFAVTAVDTAGNESGYCPEATKAIASSADTTAPAVAIAQPTSAATYATTSGSINLSGSASDNIGLSSVTWTSSSGASGSATGTTAWSISSIPLTAGSNTLTVTARDASGNQSNDSLIVTYTPGTTETVVLDTDFYSNNNGYAYKDDRFRGTSQPAYASGAYNASAGYTGGALVVTLGGKDAAQITNGMSGGWARSFTVSGDGPVRIDLRYRLVFASAYETDECAQALVAVDGKLVSPSTVDYVKQYCGLSPAAAQDSGWQLITINLNLTSGTHTLTIGGWNNKKTEKAESTKIYFDDIKVTQIR